MTGCKLLRAMPTALSLVLVAGGAPALADVPPKLRSAVFAITAASWPSLVAWLSILPALLCAVPSDTSHEGAVSLAALGAVIASM